MKRGLTELVMILDRSGSMCGLEADTIGGFNSMIEKQKKEDGEVYVSTVLFDDQIDVIYDRVVISKIEPRKEIQMTLLELPITEKVFALSIMMDEVIAACRQTQKELPRVIKNLSIEDIDPFPDHPYYVEDDANMKDLICSIKKHGVLSPGIVRTKVDGRYEMLSGHRRLYACRL